MQIGRIRAAMLANGTNDPYASFKENMCTDAGYLYDPTGRFRFDYCCLACKQFRELICGDICRRDAFYSWRLWTSAQGSELRWNESIKHSIGRHLRR